MPSPKASKQPPAPPAAPPRRPEIKIGPFAGITVAIWLNRADTTDGSVRHFRSVTINPRRYRDRHTGEWKDGSYSPGDIPALIYAWAKPKHNAVGEIACASGSERPIIPIQELLRLARWSRDRCLKQGGQSCTPDGCETSPPRHSVPESLPGAEALLGRTSSGQASQSPRGVEFDDCPTAHDASRQKGGVA